MKKYIASNKSPNVISEYDVDNNIIHITYSNGDVKDIPFSIENIKELDILMLIQHQDYQFNVSDIANKKDLAISLGIGATVSLVCFVSGIDNINAQQIGLYLLAGLSASALYGLLNKEAKLDSIEDDYYKDKFLLDNYSIIEDIILSDNGYNSLSSKLQEELIDVHNGKIPLSINSIKDLSIRDVANIMYNPDELEKPKIRKR